jgi:hypothetical protein
LSYLVSDDVFLQQQHYLVRRGFFPLPQVFEVFGIPGCTVEDVSSVDDSVLLKDLLVLCLFVELNPHVKECSKAAEAKDEVDHHKGVS